MGRRTFESIGRALPGRTSIVLTRNPAYRPPEGVLVARSVAHALALCGREEEVFVIGGAEVYRRTLPILDRLYVTLVHAEVEGDARFPRLDEEQWRLVSEERREADRDNEFAHSFRLLERVGAASGAAGGA
jgi:dihydrofolate reductase